MKVKYVGVKLLSQSIGIDTSSFYSELEAASGMVVKGESMERHFFFDNSAKEGYFIGLVVTLKDQKRFCKAEVKDQEVRLKTEDLLGDDKLVDVGSRVIDHPLGK